VAFRRHFLLVEQYLLLLLFIDSRLVINLCVKHRVLL